jgi:spore maturation protein CgeB
LKLIYVGQLWPGCTSHARAQVIKDEGWELVELDATPYQNLSPRLLRAIEHRAIDGPNVRRLNRDLIALARSHKDASTVWIDKGRWIFPETLRELKKLGLTLVHYTADTAFWVHRSRHFDRGIPEYDLCITTKKYDLDDYRIRGAKDIVFTWQGIDERFQRLGAVNEHATEQLAFIGHYEPYYDSVLSTVAAEFGGLRIWGPGWDRLKERAVLRRCVAGGALWGDRYCLALASAKIGLGFLSKRYPDQFTTRSFEIPASGALLLAERTCEHQELFEEGLEADFFSSERELLAKLDYYLRNEQTRVRIATAGRRRALCQYSWRSVLKPALSFIRQHT